MLLTKEETGVGAAMASGSHAGKGIWAPDIVAQLLHLLKFLLTYLASKLFWIRLDHSKSCFGSINDSSIIRLQNGLGYRLHSDPVRARLAVLNCCFIIAVVIRVSTFQPVSNQVKRLNQKNIFRTIKISSFDVSTFFSPVCYLLRPVWPDVRIKSSPKFSKSLPKK